MPDNPLQNGDFAAWEGGHHRVLVLPVNGEPYEAERGNVLVPPRWDGAWHVHDPQGAPAGFLRQPEVRDARATDPDRFVSPPAGLVLFTFSSTHDGGLYQRVEVQEGARYRLSAQAHAWSNHSDPSEPGKFPHPDDPRWSEGAGYDAFFALADADGLTDEQKNMTFWLGVDLQARVGDQVKLGEIAWGKGAHIYNVFAPVPPVEFETTGPDVTLFLRSAALWRFKHCDAYWDSVALERVTGPDHDKRPGDPRVDYPRTYVLTHPHDVQDMANAASWALGDANLQYTIGRSADDAGMGPLSNKTVIVINPHLWGESPSIFEFFHEYYPDVKRVEGITSDVPTDVYGRLKRKEYDPDKWTPEPPPGNGDNGNGQDPEPEDPGVFFGGIHMLQKPPRGGAEFQAQGPSLYKAVDNFDALATAYHQAPDKHKPRYPEMYMRRWHQNEGGDEFRYHPDKVAASGRWFHELYAPGIRYVMKEKGVPRVWVHAINEVWEHDIELNQHAIDFTWHLIDHVAAWSRQEGLDVRVAAASMAVGNPKMPNEAGGEEQWQRILPLARKLQDHGGRFVYHAYGILIVDDPGALPRYAPYLQNRWFSYYEWLKAHNAAVPFMLGEGFLVQGSVTHAATTAAADVVIQAQAMQASDLYAVPIPTEGEILMLRKRRTLYPTESATAGIGLNPGQGWNGLISWDRAQREYVEFFHDPFYAFNEAHDWKATPGMTAFQSGNESDWKGFNIEGPPLVSLGQALRAAVKAA